jgi:hypothetical protein
MAGEETEDEGRQLVGSFQRRKGLKNDLEAQKQWYGVHMTFMAQKWPHNILLCSGLSLLTSAGVRAAPATNTLQYREYHPRLPQYTKTERISKMKEVEGRIQDLQGAAAKVHAGEVYLSSLSHHASDVKGKRAD